MPCEGNRIYAVLFECCLYRRIAVIFSRNIEPRPVDGSGTGFADEIIQTFERWPFAVNDPTAKLS